MTHGHFWKIMAGGLLLLVGAVPALAQPYDIPVSDGAGIMSASAPVFRAETAHEVHIRGQRVRYRVVSGETVLRDLDGAETGRIFAFSYLRTDAVATDRPVLFVFNGGPGSASLWLHMGVIGPRRLVLDQEVNPSNVPPFGLTDNPVSVLDVADLVFIDPVGTGFSRPAPGVDPALFWGVDEDAESIAQFIELWLTEHGRWNSPKYVLGESYGTVRAAVLPRALMGSPIYNGVMRGITLDGVILLGTTLAGRGNGGAPDGETLAAARARSLPGLAVTAAYHGRSSLETDDPEAVYAAAAAYADGPYRAALADLQAGTLSPSDRAEILAQLEVFVGLDAETIGEDLYISERDYARTLLTDAGLEAGVYDSRYTLPLASSGRDPVADDPAMGQYVPGFVSAFNRMLGEELGVDTGRAYTAIRWRDLLPAWNWERRGVEPGQSFAVDLAWSMRRNRDLRVFVASGYYDLVTTPADARASISEAGLPEDRVRFEEYPSGHMLYLGGTAQAFAEDLRTFLTAH
ncbi:MAG: septum formation initiator [Maricaulis sp.]|nr:septum formation initiator [Maricaulis sp.]